VSRRRKIDLVVVGPETPLALGIVDVFRKAGIPIFGPDSTGALLEASKVFSKTLMEKNAVPTAPFAVFTDFNAASRYVNSVSPPYVIKADGLCAGKGAYVIRTREEGEATIRELMVKGVHGEAGRRIVVENFIEGIEASYIAFTDGKTIVPLLPAQDHKPLLDDDRGPNTGGMGAYTPIPFIDSALEKKIKVEIMQATIDALDREGIVYRGAIYGGLMLRGSKADVIEFNARLGDPETQPVLFHMKSDIAPYLVASVEGSLHTVEPITWKEGVTVCVVLASKGYPDRPEKGKVIKGLEDLKNRSDVMVFHAGTKKIGNEYFTAGGRVLGVTATGADYREAIGNAYDAVASISFEGMQYRKDIGKKALPSRVCTGSGI
jgi:phosphoribosylamine---glycine ligase